MKASQDIGRMTTQYLERVKTAMDRLSVRDIERAVRALHGAYRTGRHVFIVGNGGSASTASHMACDLSKNIFGQFRDDAAPAGRFKVLALTDGVPVMTAWANDSAYDQIFVEQVRTFVDPGDVLIAISGSGNSPNVVKATELAKSMGATTIGLLGFAGGKLTTLVDIPLVVDSDDYGAIEDIHLMLNHLLTACLRDVIAAETIA